MKILIKSSLIISVIILFTKISLSANNDIIYAWGDNRSGQIGNGNIENQLLPHKLNIKIKSISLGYEYVLVVKEDGSLWGWGDDENNQIIDSNEFGKIWSLPVQIGNEKNWKYVSAGISTSFAIKDDSTLWGWGNNLTGQLGIGNKIEQKIPVQIGKEKKWVYVTSGALHTFGLEDDGALWAWGSNLWGQLGIGNNVSQLNPILVSNEKNWKQIIGGLDFTIALKNDGTLWTCGKNMYGQLGISNNEGKNAFTQVGNDNDWKSISTNSSSAFVLAIKTDGTLWAWGNNLGSQLGIGNNTNQNIPMQVGIEKNWNSISAGQHHSLAIKDDSTLWVWGVNNYGNLGDGTKISQSIPIHSKSIEKVVQIFAGGQYSLAISKSNTILPPIVNTLKTIDFSANTADIEAEFISNGGDKIKEMGIVYSKIANPDINDEKITIESNLGKFSFFIKNLNENTEYYVRAFATNSGGTTYGKNILFKTTKSRIIKSWGRNFDFALGHGNIKQINVPTEIKHLRNFRSVEASDQHTLAINEDGTLLGWGSTKEWELLTDDIWEVEPIRLGGDYKWKQVSAGSNFSLAIQEDGSLWGWGYNGIHSHLGMGISENVKRITQLIKDTKWKYVSAGYISSFGIQEDGTLWGWGDNRLGILGIGSDSIIKNPIQIGDKKWKSVSAGNSTLGIMEDGTLWTWGKSPIQIGIDNNWKVISSGRSMFGIKEDGSLWAWGFNDFGQLGTGDNENKIDPVQVGKDNNWKYISQGFNHTLALKSDGSLWAWGDNEFGQLGTGDTLSTNYPKQIGNDYDWINISTGNYCSFALKEDVIDNIEDITLENINFKLYPNPTNDELNIELQTEFINSKISIINEVGTEVYNSIIQSENFSINTLDFPNGKYFIIINNGKENISDSFVIER